MRVSSGLQPNHSEWMRLVAEFEDSQRAKQVHGGFVKLLNSLFRRADRFSCAGFGRSFGSRDEFEEWKKREWASVADEHCHLEVEDAEEGRVHVWGDYGLIIDDWSRDELGIAREASAIALRVYTAGYGLDHLGRWLEERGATVTVVEEGMEYDYEALEDAVQEAKAQARKRRTDRLRAGDRHYSPVQPGRDECGPGT